jgi:hypothetical protein
MATQTPEVVVWLRSYERSALLESAIGQAAHDPRAAFCVVVDIDSREIVDVVAIPPSAVDFYGDHIRRYFGQRRTMPLDRHFSVGCAEDTERLRVLVQDCMTTMLSGWTLPGELVAELLHARRMAFSAATRPVNWQNRIESASATGVME